MGALNSLLILCFWNCSNKLSLETRESSWGKEIYTQEKGDVSLNVSWTLTMLLSRLIGMFLLHFSLLTNIFHLRWMLSLVIVCIVIKAKNVLFKKIECWSDLIKIKFVKLWGSSGFSERKESSEHNWANNYLRDDLPHNASFGK